jgi:hypothetical protein
MSRTIMATAPLGEIALESTKPYMVSFASSWVKVTYERERMVRYVVPVLWADRQK